jgi:hypothetical protein
MRIPSNSKLSRAVRTASRIGSTMPIGVAVALALALGLGAALVQPLRAEAVPARAAEVSHAVVPLQTETPTLPVPIPTLAPTVSVATPTPVGSTGTSSACPSLDPSSGCTFFGVPDWLLAVLAAALILILVVVAVAASGRRR